jgi:hypothetical protein
MGLYLIICFSFGLITLGMVILAFCNKYLSRWACDKLGWHLAPKEQGFDGCSFCGLCPRCNKPVLQDSQGNWF